MLFSFSKKIKKIDFVFLFFWIFWLYLGNKEIYWGFRWCQNNSWGFLLGVGVTGYLCGSLSLSARKGAKDKSRGLKGLQLSVETKFVMWRNSDCLTQKTEPTQNVTKFRRPKKFELFDGRKEGWKENIDGYKKVAAVNNFSCRVMRITKSYREKMSKALLLTMTISWVTTFK